MAARSGRTTGRVRWVRVPESCQVRATRQQPGHPAGRGSHRVPQAVGRGDPARSRDHRSLPQARGRRDTPCRRSRYDCSTSSAVLRGHHDVERSSSPPPGGDISVPSSVDAAAAFTDGASRCHRPGSLARHGPPLRRVSADGGPGGDRPGRRTSPGPPAARRHPPRRHRRPGRSSAHRQPGQRRRQRAGTGPDPGRPARDAVRLRRRRSVRTGPARGSTTADGPTRRSVLGRVRRGPTAPKPRPFGPSSLSSARATLNREGQDRR